VNGIFENWFIVLVSFVMLVVGTVAAYKKHGLKRVLLGKNNDSRELVYKRTDGSIIWSSTLKTWGIIFTGGMSLLSLFLLVMLLVLSFVYQHDIAATRHNDELLCQTFGTINPSQEQLEEYYGNSNFKVNLGDIGDGRDT